MSVLMMGIGPWKRARSPEQKAQRERAILDAAAGLFLDKGFDKTSMRSIGCKAGLSKGNLYRYFKTKEEVFLKLYLEDFNAWLDEVLALLEAKRRGGDLPWLADAMARSLFRRPRMGGLTALLAGVLERNVPWEVLLQFKEEIVRRAMRLTAAIHAAVPRISEEQAVRFLRMVHIYAAGLWPTANPSPELERAVASSELLSQFHADFEQDLSRSIRTILAGILEEPRHFPVERQDEVTP